MILLIDGDVRFRQSLHAALTFGGFVVISASSYREAIESVFMAGTSPRCVVLDVDLDDGCGLAAMNQIRRGHPVLPIIATASRRKGHGMESLVFNSGADEYIEKPFSPMDILHRISNISRPSPLNEKIKQGNVSLDVETGGLFIDGRPLVLCSSRQKVLTALLRKRGGVVPRSTLMKLSDVDSETALEALVSRIRKDIKEAGAKVRILSATNSGYHMEPVDRE